MMTEAENKRKKKKEEHVLACLSGAPSNARIIRAAAQMAEAYNGQFTAVYVEENSARRKGSDRTSLEKNIRLAESLGADIVTLYGEDVPTQIAEFARISGVSQIVLGRNNARHVWFPGPVSLTDRLIQIAPEIDIHIIPDAVKTRHGFRNGEQFTQNLIPKGTDFLVTALILAAVTAIGMLFVKLGFTESNIIPVYILSVLLTAIFTRGYLCSAISAVMSVILYNFFLTEPRFTFHAYGSGYPVTFAIMLIASVITGTLTSKLKDQVKVSAQAAYRTKVLFDTNQLLQKGKDEREILEVVAMQIVKLLGRDVVVYPEEEGNMLLPIFYPDENRKDDEPFLRGSEQEVARWVFQNRKKAGATTDHYKNAYGLYLAIRINQQVYGVIGIAVDGHPLEMMENSIVLSILGECALAIGNMRNAREKEEAAVMARNEQLRANLLRAISHDLRTPLTTISGNADNLITNERGLDDVTRMQVYEDIYEDAQWLTDLVENLLSISRIEEGQLNLHYSMQGIDEVIAEALHHIRQRDHSHPIEFVPSDEILVAKMDARLIIQVLVNLILNAVKHTPGGTPIRICSRKEDDHVMICVADQGQGIPDSQKDRVFEMFYTGDFAVADSRRSLGLGLALCRSIIHAHGGQISVRDNEPRGCEFFFTLPAAEAYNLDKEKEEGSDSEQNADPDRGR